MFEDFDYFTDILLKLKVEERLSIVRGGLGQPVLLLGNMSSYSLPYGNGVAPIEVRRTLMGPVLRVPSLYPGRLTYSNNQFVNSWRG